MSSPVSFVIFVTHFTALLVGPSNVKGRNFQVKVVNSNKNDKGDHKHTFTMNKDFFEAEEHKHHLKRVRHIDQNENVFGKDLTPIKDGNENYDDVIIKFAEIAVPVESDTKKETTDTRYLTNFTKRISDLLFGKKVIDTTEDRHPPNDKGWDILSLCSTRYCPEYELNICAVKIVMGKKMYRDFFNDCLYSMFNYCDTHSTARYMIVSSEPCSRYLRSFRRHEFESDMVPLNKPLTLVLRGNSKKDENDAPSNKQTETTVNPQEVLRQFNDLPTASTKFPRSNITCNHECPAVCTDDYAPVCLAYNRMNGRTSKYYSFLNHCAMDKFLCEHIHNDDFNTGRTFEFNNLEDSLCGNNRYMQMFRTSQMISSLGHYGWLQGDEKYSAIIE